MKERRKEIQVSVQTDVGRKVLEAPVDWEEPETLKEAMEMLGEKMVLRVIQIHVETKASMKVRSEVLAPYREIQAARMWESLKRIAEGLEERASK